MALIGVTLDKIGISMKQKFPYLFFKCVIYLMLFYILIFNQKKFANHLVYLSLVPAGMH